MNKALYAFVYIFLALAGGALFFEIQLNAKRTELTDRNRMQEDYYVSIAKTIEKAEPNKDASFEIMKDDEAVENKLLDDVEKKNLLDDYSAPLEQTNLQTFQWEGQRSALRQVYILDGEGKPVMDGTDPLKRGSPLDKHLSELFEAAKTQQARLNSTRSALTEMRERLARVVEELNDLKPKARQSLVTIDEKNDKIKKLEEEKTALEDQIVKLKAQIEELNGEITSLKDEVQTAKDETEAAKEELAKTQKQVEQLRKMLAEAIQSASQRAANSTVSAVTSLPAGEKGKLVDVDNENMFAIVQFTDAAMKELKGEDLSRPMPALEFGLKRKGYNGEAGEFIGRIRLRQEINGKNYIICDILSAWEQEKAQPDDIVFAD